MTNPKSPTITIRALNNTTMEVPRWFVEQGNSPFDVVQVKRALLKRVPAKPQLVPVPASSLLTLRGTPRKNRVKGEEPPERERKTERTIKTNAGYTYKPSYGPVWIKRVITGNVREKAHDVKLRLHAEALGLDPTDLTFDELVLEVGRLLRERG